MPPVPRPATTQALAENRRSAPLTVPEPVIDVSNPWSDDTLRRASLAGTLTTLIRNQQGPLTISINGSWGSGKTFFLQRWQAQLTSEKVPTFYYNAWNDDFGSDPLIPILAKITALQPTAKAVAAESFALARQNLVPTLQEHLGNFLKARYGFDPYGLFRNNPDAALDDYAQLRGHRDKLRHALSDWSEALTAGDSSPAICFVDELDRCRPTYAIELLERIKHILNIPRLVFVFGLNQVELEKSIGAVYGPIDCSSYLRRFFDIVLSLPRPDPTTYIKANPAHDYLASFFARRNAILGRAGYRIYVDEFPDIVSSISTLCALFGLSLRDMNQCLSLLGLYGATLTTQTGLYPYLISALLVLRIKDRSLYEKWVDGHCSGADVMSRFEEWIGPDLSERTQNAVDLLEVSLYATSIRDQSLPDEMEYPDSPFAELALIRSGKPPARPHLLSASTREAGAVRATSLLQTYKNLIPRGREFYTSSRTLRDLANLLEMRSVTIF